MYYIQESDWSLVTAYHPVPFFIYTGQIIPSVHSVGRVSSSHIFVINLCILVFNSVPPCFISCAGVLSDPAASCILNFSST